MQGGSRQGEGENESDDGAPGGGAGLSSLCTTKEYEVGKVGTQVTKRGEKKRGREGQKRAAR